MMRARSGKTAAGRLLLGGGVLALMIPAIAGCEAGNGAPTLQFHAASFGQQTVFNGIRITNVFVLGGPAGATVPSGSSAGLFASFYNGGAASDTLVSAAAPGTAKTVSLPGGSVSLPIDAAPVNLTGPQPEVVLQHLSTPLRSGSNVTVTFTFAQSGTVTMTVPVEAQAYQWATFSPPTASASATGSGAASPSTSASPTAPNAATPASSASPSTSGSATP